MGSVPAGMRCSGWGVTAGGAAWGSDRRGPRQRSRGRSPGAGRYSRQVPQGDRPGRTGKACRAGMRDGHLVSRVPLVARQRLPAKAGRLYGKTPGIATGNVLLVVSTTSWRCLPFQGLTIRINKCKLVLSIAEVRGKGIVQGPAFLNS